MNKIVLFCIFLINAYLAFGQDTKEIQKIEIYAVEYDATYYMPPLLDELKEMGLFVSHSSEEIKSSKLLERLNELEMERNEQIDSLEIEGNSRAVITLYLDEKLKEDLYILRGSIVWKNKKYKMYYPVLESVYYFLPDRYMKREINKMLYSNEE